VQSRHIAMAAPSPASLPARCGIAILSGVAYALAFPPLGWRWLVVPGIAGLLLALRGLRGAQARGVGFLHGMAAYAVGVPWMWLLFGVQATALWAILALFTVAFAVMQSRAETHGWSGWRLTAFTLLNWGGWEFIRAEIFPLKFPWMTAGLAWGPNRLLPWVGVYGVSALIVLGISTLTSAPRKWKTAGLLPLALLCAALIEGPDTLEKHDKTIIVGAVQLEQGTLKRYAQMTRTLEPDTDHVCWPEYALPYDVRARKRDMEALQALCVERSITLTVGRRPVQLMEAAGRTRRSRSMPMEFWGNTTRCTRCTSSMMAFQGGERFLLRPRMERWARPSASIATTRAQSGG
jgi:apolipoprotein N-acyltransferase